MDKKTIQVEICWIHASGMAAMATTLQLASGATWGECLSHSGFIDSPHWHKTLVRTVKNEISFEQSKHSSTTRQTHKQQNASNHLAWSQGKKMELWHHLQDGQRIVMATPLFVDPKTMRRRRARLTKVL